MKIFHCFVHFRFQTNAKIIIQPSDRSRKLLLEFTTSRHVEHNEFLQQHIWLHLVGPSSEPFSSFSASTLNPLTETAASFFSSSSAPRSRTTSVSSHSSLSYRDEPSPLPAVGGPPTMDLSHLSAEERRQRLRGRSCGKGLGGRSPRCCPRHASAPAPPPSLQAVGWPSRRDSYSSSSRNDSSNYNVLSYLYLLFIRIKKV